MINIGSRPQFYRQEPILQTVLGVTRYIPTVKLEYAASNGNRERERD